MVLSIDEPVETRYVDLGRKQSGEVAAAGIYTNKVCAASTAGHSVGQLWPAVGRTEQHINMQLRAPLQVKRVLVKYSSCPG